MSNNISFVGRLGSDPELKNVGDYTVLELNVANNRGFGDKKITNWFRCTIWGSRGEKLQSFLSKGKQVFITGELSLRKFTGNDGVEKTSAEVKVDQLDFISGGDGGSNTEFSAPTPAAQAAPSNSSSPETDEDLPF
jgi:single-strand DNA-binding protein